MLIKTILKIEEFILYTLYGLFRNDITGNHWLNKFGISLSNNIIKNSFGYYDSNPKTDRQKEKQLEKERKHIRESYLFAFPIERLEKWYSYMSEYEKKIKEYTKI